MNTFKVLFCFSSDVAPMIQELVSYCQKNNLVFDAKNVSSYAEIEEYKKDNNINCIVLQEYFDVSEPVTVERLFDISSSANIRTICIFDESKRNEYRNELYRNKLFDCFFGDDATELRIEDFVDIILNGRDEAEAISYYAIDKNALYETEKLSQSAYHDRLIENIAIENFDKKSECNIYAGRLGNIGVVNLSAGAGASFIAMNFANALSEIMSVSVIEMPLLEPYMYNYLGLNSLCAEGIVDFTSFAHLIADKKSINDNFYVHNKNRNINWLILDSSLPRITSWDAISMMRLMYLNKSSSINIIDLGNKLFDMSIYEIIEQFTRIIVVVDPMIPNLIGSRKLIEKLYKLEENNGVKISFVINKYCDGVDVESITNFIGTRPICNIPFVNQASIYKAVYKGELVVNFENIKKILYPEFGKIIKKLFPTDVYKKWLEFNKKI